jgi:hypothetical protein
VLGMMTAWSFATNMVDEVASLLRALGKHRYVKEADHRIHFTVDQALVDIPAFAAHAARFAERVKREPKLDLASNDPTLWRAATVDEVIAVFTAFWGAGEEFDARIDRLAEAMTDANLEIPDHEPWETEAEEPPFPELITLDWVLLPVDELDAERHKGVLEALEGTKEEFNPSAPIYQEGPTITAVELADGAPNGILVGDFLVWSEAPYAYADYVFRGASKVAKLVSAPVGVRDLEQLDEFDAEEDDEDEDG